MEKHEKFLNFNGQKIILIDKDGNYWIALKPILDAFNLPSDRYLKRVKRDPFFSTCLDTMSIQVENNGIIQGRKMVCMTEEFIYGWICTLNAKDEALNKYKRTCYQLLYKHFHGTITNRKDLLLKRTEVDSEIDKIEKRLKDSQEEYKRLQDLKSNRRKINKNLNNLDSELLRQTEIQFN